MKIPTTRRSFLKCTTLAAAAFAAGGWTYKKYQPLLSFSTLGCPEWSFETILNFAASHGYQGIELRGIQKEMDLSKVFTQSKIGDTKKAIADKGLDIVDLGSSAALHLPEGTERQQNMDEARRFIDLAEALGCPYIRVFPNNFPEGQSHEKTIELIVNGLQQLGDYAKNTSVTVLMETHGDVVESTTIQNIMQQTNHPKTGLVWDPVNMWFKTKEPPTHAYEAIKNYIQHVHVKDLNIVDNKEHYVLLGKGESPILEALKVLAKNNYKGYYSFEWEKLWHLEIAAPEIALADYPTAINNYFQKIT